MREKVHLFSAVCVHVWQYVYFFALSLYIVCGVNCLLNSVAHILLFVKLFITLLRLCEWLLTMFFISFDSVLICRFMGLEPNEMHPCDLQVFAASTGKCFCGIFFHLSLRLLWVEHYIEHILKHVSEAEPISFGEVNVLSSDVSYVCDFTLKFD